MDFVKEALIQNEHWNSGVVVFPRLSSLLVEREVFSFLEESTQKKFVTVLRGIRRTGKSFLARKLAEKTIQGFGNPKSVGWFEFDRAMNASSDDLDALLRFFGEQGCKTIIFDEIAFVSKWQDVLKRHYDRSNLKFVVTGSSALELDKRTSESLAGRFETIKVKPFSFKESLFQKGINVPANAREMALRAEELEFECEKYLRAGGLPEIASEKDEFARRKYVNESLLEPLFYKDLPAAFPNANPDLLRKTLELLSASVGGLFQHQNLAQILGVSHPTAATQVELLEKSLLVWASFNKTPSLAKQKRTAKKIVFADNGILTALNPEIPVSVLAENAVASFFESKNFWRNSLDREIDVILPEKKLAIEVKYAENATAWDEKNLKIFLEKNPGWRGILVTKKDESEHEGIRRIPLWKMLLGSL